MNRRQLFRGMLAAGCLAVGRFFPCPDRPALDARVSDNALAMMDDALDAISPPTHIYVAVYTVDPDRPDKRLEDLEWVKAPEQPYRYSCTTPFPEF